MHFDSTDPPTTDNSLRGSWRTAASPPDFAPPVAAEDDGAALVMVFDVQNLDIDKLAVEVTESAVVLHGNATPHAPPGEGSTRRYFALPRGMDPATTETRFDGQHLFIRIARPAIDVAFEQPEADADAPAPMPTELRMTAIRAPLPMHRWPYTPRGAVRSKRRR
jgi:HSP20 family molecular chaperone IbpA